MDRTVLARTLAIATIAFAFLFYTIGGLAKPGYSHVSNFISELNASGTAWAATFSFAGFLPMGLLLAAFLVVAAPLVAVRGLSRIGYSLLWSQPLALVGTAFAPCDAGCPTDGSRTQDIHNLLGVATYFAAGLGIVLLSFAPALEGREKIWRSVLRVAALVFLAIFILMLQPGFAPWRGLIQRFLEVVLAALLMFVAWRLIPRTRSRRG
jgi:hypothetical protein